MLDPYVNDEECIQRLVREYQTHDSLVVAFDFDDTVYDFHKKGRTYTRVIELLRKALQANCYLIAWTGSEDISFVRLYLTEHAIPFHAINENPPFSKSTSRKIYANIYLDDRAGLSASVYHLEETLNRVEQDIHRKYR
jgi:hydroxymethylpyrimidine pyrophosphatase-like HAD family hydrolase